MSFGNLSPKDAADAAAAVYGIRLDDNVAQAFKNTAIKDKFALSTDTKFSGKSGLLRSKSGFGVIAKGTGVHQGEVVIITRGTKTGADWYSNARIKTCLSSNNQSVHSGFNDIFHSFKEDLAVQLLAANPTRVHCIGHSLGGALASLIAEWVNIKGLAKNTHLYTFGCPRVGTQRFAENLTTNLGATRINRAYHKTDVVPMIPIWPYVHGPAPGLSCFIDSPGNFPGAEYHSMNLYISSVKKHKDWDSLRKRGPKSNMEKQVENWLNSGSPLALTGNTITMINSAILYVIKKLALAGLQFVVGEAVNMVDALAMFFVKAAKIAKTTFSLVGQLMKRILQAVGIVVSTTASITYSFVKWVLESLSAALNGIANMAMGFVHRGL